MSSIAGTRLTHDIWSNERQVVTWSLGPDRDVEQSDNVEVAELSVFTEHVSYQCVFHHVADLSV